MPVATLSATEALRRLAEFDTVIDARTEDEHALDHVPGALNWPTLNNAERIEIGTMYKQVSPFEAKKRGAMLAARNIAAHIEREVLDTPKGWRPLVYCWRGGNRSGAMALVLSQIGWKADLVEGGYKAYRREVIEALAPLSARLCFRVLCGPTGSGKTRLLGALADAGAQVLDLEGLAAHRGSVLGAYPQASQPSQKMFESRLWDALRRFDPARPVFVEAESKRVGRVHVPDPLIDAIRGGECLRVETPMPVRVALLLEEYSHFLADTTQLAEQLAYLAPLHGNKTIAQWLSLVQAGQAGEFVEAMLRSHYDPTYTRSMTRNFLAYDAAPAVSITDAGQAAFAAAAQNLHVSLPTGG